MKIVFLGFSSCFTDGMGYQDNLYLDICRSNGYETVYLASTECFRNGEIIDVDPIDVFLKNGVHLYRLPYKKIGPAFVYKKLRIITNTYRILELEKPDVIFCHNAHYTPVIDVKRYKEKHPETRIFADTHVNKYNSGSNWLSINILHRIYYRILIKRLVPSLEKFYYISPPCGDFLKRIYKVPEKKMAFLPLGGKVFSEEILKEIREKIRNEYDIQPDEILFLHSGKLDALKKTDDLLKAFQAVPNLPARLFIVGSIPDERKSVLMDLISSDNRIHYLGWKTSEELFRLLCATDLYCQPGSPSATLQQAICNGCACMAYPYELYQIINRDNIIWCKSFEDIKQIFEDISTKKISISYYKNNARVCCMTYLDFNKQVDDFTL